MTLRYFSLVIILGMSCAAAFAQPANTKPPKEIFRDSDGNLISNNEFVDLRLANPRAKDPATKTILDDGTIEFRLAKVPQEGTTAPLFEAPTIDGSLINSGDLKGKVIVLNFWFIGCPGCMEEIPKLNALAAEFSQRGDVKFIAISPDTHEGLQQFLSRVKFDYKQVDSALSIVNLFNFTGFPRNIVIGRDGKIVYWRTTVRAWDKFDSVIKAELNKN